MASLFFKSSKSATSKRSSLPLAGSLRSDGPPLLPCPPSSLRRALESRLLVVLVVVPTGRRRFATALLAEVNMLDMKLDLSAFSWVGDPYSGGMVASSSRESVEDEAGDAGSWGEFMAG